MTKTSDKQGQKTKERLIAAALEALKTVGFVGASSRVIARVAEVNQALVFYHFGSVDALLLVALEEASAARLTRYREELADAHSFEELVQNVSALAREDRDSGHAQVIAQMVAGSVARPELAPEVLARMEPWIAFSEQEIERLLRGSPFAAFVRTSNLAYALVVFYFGVNLLGHLDEDDSRTDALFSEAERLAPLISPFMRGVGPGRVKPGPGRAA